MDLLLALAVFLLLASVGAALADRERDRLAASERLSHIPHGDEMGQQSGRRCEPSRAARNLFDKKPRANPIRLLEQQIWQAGLYQGVDSILLTIGVLLVCGAGLGVLVSGDPLIAVGVSVVFAITPLLYIRIRRSRRFKSFLLQLPFALDLLKSTLEAGHTLQRGMQVVEQEFAEPLGGEFRTVVEQTRLGIPVTEALSQMLRRVPLDDLRLFVVAVKVQTEVGSSLAQIIARLSEIVRTRQRLFSQIRALTAQSRMSGMVVGFLPVVVLAMFTIIQPSYAEMLFFDRTGKMILKVAMGLDFGAFLLIRRILKVRF